MNTRTMLTMAVAGLVLVGGCARMPRRQVTRKNGRPVKTKAAQPAKLAAVSRPPIPDLPVPDGFKLDEERSRSFAAAGSRYVDHTYESRDRVDKYMLSRFYKRHMPVCRWTLLTDMFVQRKIMLDFEKEGERCRIIITEGGMMSPCTVQAQVWTHGKIAMTAAR